MSRTNRVKKIVKIEEEAISPEDFPEKGRIQYFYHSPLSELPVRDVTNKQGKGHKTEPHIEIGVENYLAECYQPSIRKFARNDERYLFLVTTCRNEKINEKLGENKTNQFIIGYIVKEKVCVIYHDKGRHMCVGGKTCIYSFDDSILVKDLFGWNFSRSELLSDKKRIVDCDKTKDILQHFSGKQDIRKDCVKEIKRLDENNQTCLKSGECECEFQKECLRRNL